MADRRQHVVVDGEVSNWKSVLSGVPQGFNLEAGCDTSVTVVIVQNKQSNISSRSSSLH